MVFGCLGRVCPFCTVSTANGFNIAHEDDQFIAFHDRSPGARVHLLVIPRKHIDNINKLTKDEIPLLEGMLELGRKLLGDQGFGPNDDTQTRFGFHVPPFNTIGHLHMHVLGLPFKGTFREWEFSPGHLWYKDATQVLEHLRH